MFFMGVGSFLSKYIEKDLIRAFIWVELFVGLLGGVSVLFLYLAFSLTDYFYLIAFVITALISICIGLELPIAARIMRAHGSLRESLAHILSFDYLGALFASILFPLVLLPYLGVMKTAFLVGALNICVALLNGIVFRNLVSSFAVYLAGGLSLAILSSGFAYSVGLQGLIDSFVYEDPVILSQQSPYQKIVLTHYGEEDTRLYLDGNLQFSAADEYRYHESLVHPAMLSVPRKSHILVLGGGDGLVIRELLRYDEVESVTLVDLDPEVVKLARKHPLLKALNKGAFDNSRVRIIHEDAYQFIERDTSQYDVIIADLPDPNSPSLGKLYSFEFYRLLSRRMDASGVFVTQASSPFFAREAFWCVEETLAAVFRYTRPYTVNVPSFGQWGFIIASGFRVEPKWTKLPAQLRFLTPVTALQLDIFPPDMDKQAVEINRLDSQALVSYYERSLF